MYDKPRNPHPPGLHLSQKYSLEMVAAAWLKCFLQGLWTAGTAGPQPSGLESLCRRLCSHLPPPGLGTEVGSRQGKQADNQVGPELRREKERIGGGGAARYVKALNDSDEARGKGMEVFVYVFVQAFPHPSKKVKGCVCFQKDQHACACTRTRNLIRTKTERAYNGYVGFVS